jgi:hypothetical protein
MINEEKTFVPKNNLEITFKAKENLNVDFHGWKYFFKKGNDYKFVKNPPDNEWKLADPGTQVGNLIRFVQKVMDDYFYSEKELRKLKLEKINEVEKG